MYLSEKLVFVELQKTGCSHITRLLAETIDGSIVGKHNAPSRQLLDSTRMFIGSIRNPWEWYVSLWAYGCDKRGHTYTKATQANNKIKATLGWFTDPLYSAHLLLNHVSRSPEQWQACYANADDPQAFRTWLYMIHDSKHWHDVGESYGKYAMSHVAGLLTYRYLKLFCRNNFTRIKTLDDLLSFEKENCYIDFFIHNENLEQDFFAALALADIHLSDEKKARVNSISKTNTSSKKYPAYYYYDNDTIDLVRNREQLIINKFGYTPPVLSKR